MASILGFIEDPDSDISKLTKEQRSLIDNLLSLLKSVNDFMEMNEKEKAEQMDLDNMYTSKQGKEDELFIDIIRVPNITYPFTVMFYRGDQRTCRRYKPPQSTRICGISKCNKATVVVANSTTLPDEVEPYIEEPNSFWIIEKHPNNEKKRMIKMAMRNKPALCELEKDDFNLNLILENQKTKSEVDKQQLQIVTTTQDYEPIKKEITKLEEEIENIKKEKNEYIKKGPDRYDPEDIPHKKLQQFEKDIIAKQDEIVKIKKEHLEKALEEVNVGIEGDVEKIKEIIEIKKKTKQYSEVSTTLCLSCDSNEKPNIMYLDSRRNDISTGYTTEWDVLREFDNSGKHTGKYKFRCEINGKKICLSLKQNIPNLDFLLSNPLFAKSIPKIEITKEEQLFLIQEIGDYNVLTQLGHNEVMQQLDVERVERGRVGDVPGRGAGSNPYIPKNTMDKILNVHIPNLEKMGPRIETSLAKIGK